MSDPVTHEIDLEELARSARAVMRYGDCLSRAVAEVIPVLIARLRAAEARAEAAVAERDALRARVPTEDEIAHLQDVIEEIDALETDELARYGYSDAGPMLAALRALVARNTPKETNPNG